ncbi:MAG: transporter [Verrucomicrobia bacterium]|nr:transporter [Verrucomicrobiota bacterium]
MKTHKLSLALAALAAIATPLSAEEGGSGHYIPGSMSSFIDSVPPSETFIARLNIATYDGSFSKDLSIAGIRAGAVDANSFAAGLTLLWRPPLDMGENWSYAMSATVPWVWMDVSANVQATRGGVPVTIRRSDNENGLGDIVLIPLMLNYKFSPDFSANFRVAAYTPTGDYQVGRLANTGKNYWTFEPTFALMYFGQKNGFEASLVTGYDFTPENNATNYQTGNQFHMDGTLAQHFPVAGGLAGAGVSGFWYKQVTGDSGAGATLGSFEGSTSGIGPVISYTKKLGNVDMIAELKWLHELETTRRLEGDYIWFKLVLKF